MIRFTFYKSYHSYSLEGSSNLMNGGKNLCESLETGRVVKSQNVKAGALANVVTVKKKKKKVRSSYS